MFEPSVYAARRTALLAELAARGLREGIILLIGNGESPMNYLDNAYPFRQDSSFLYFFGPDRPDLAGTIDIGSGEATLFGDDLSLDDIVWTGPRPTIAEMAAAAGLQRSAPRSRLSAAIAGKAALLYLPPYRAETRAELAALLGLAYGKVDAGVSLPLIQSAIALRERKSALEVAELETAVAISTEMHRAAIATARPGLRESDIAARVAEVALASGRLAFPTIATTRGATLHIHSYDKPLVEGGLFLLDAGAEPPSGYAGDLSSTFPIGKRYDRRQREIYDIVLSAHVAATAALSPGRPFKEAHFAAARAIAAGLKGLGLMKGDMEEAVAAGAHALFFPHGIGHQIGLDVHDMENYGEVWVGYDGEPKSELFGLCSLRLAKPLKPGMVHSVEPGIYFIPELVARWEGERRFSDFICYDKLGPWMSLGGIRNEEDWLITETGARRLGPAFDKRAEAIEALKG